MGIVTSLIILTLIFFCMDGFLFYFWQKALKENTYNNCKELEKNVRELQLNLFGKVQDLKESQDELQLKSKEISNLHSIIESYKLKTSELQRDIELLIKENKDIKNKRV